MTDSALYKIDEVLFIQVDQFINRDAKSAVRYTVKGMCYTSVISAIPDPLQLGDIVRDV